MELRLLFDGAIDDKVVAVAQQLKKRQPRIEITYGVFNIQNPENRNLFPMPSGHFRGESRMHEYGREGVLMLMDDIMKGRVY
jgi:hypothetical protein